MVGKDGYDWEHLGQLRTSEQGCRPRERERVGLRCIGSKRLGTSHVWSEGGGEGTSVNKAGHRLPASARSLLVAGGSGSGRSVICVCAHGESRASGNPGQ